MITVIFEATGLHCKSNDALIAAVTASGPSPPARIMSWLSTGTRKGRTSRSVERLETLLHLGNVARKVKVLRDVRVVLRRVIAIQHILSATPEGRGRRGGPVGDETNPKGFGGAQFLRLKDVGNDDSVAGSQELLSTVCSERLTQCSSWQRQCKILETSEVSTVPPQSNSARRTHGTTVCKLLSAHIPQRDRLAGTYVQSMMKTTSTPHHHQLSFPALQSRTHSRAACPPIRSARCFPASRSWRR